MTMVMTMVMVMMMMMMMMMMMPPTTHPLDEEQPAVVRDGLGELHDRLFGEAVPVGSMAALVPRRAVARPRAVVTVDQRAMRD
jgi:hypothetical protein